MWLFIVQNSLRWRFSWISSNHKALLLNTRVFLFTILHTYQIADCNIALNIVWIMWSCGIHCVDGCCVLTDQPPDLTTLYSSLHNEHSHALSRYFIALLKKCITNCLPSVSLVICVCVYMCVMDVMIVVTYNISWHKIP